MRVFRVLVGRAGEPSRQPGKGMRWGVKGGRNGEIGENAASEWDFGC